MQNDFFNELKKLFEKLPGIGPRQASRFIWAILDFSDSERKKMAELINSLEKHLLRCGRCLRTAPAEASAKAGFICSFCQPNSSRDRNKIMVVERDGDLINIEKSGIYKGLYHVLGGAFDPLEENGVVRERIKKLHERLNNMPMVAKSGAEAREIILALSPTKLGEFTNNYIIKILEPITKSRNIKISRLGRGLASGTDLEYADETTLRQAIDNRK